VQDNVVVAMVLLWRVAYDVVVEEGHRASLWRVGLWRDYIEGVNFGVGCREEGAWANVIGTWTPFTQTISKQGDDPDSLQFGRPVAWARGTDAKTSVKAAMVIMAMRTRMVFWRCVIFPTCHAGF